MNNHPCIEAARVPRSLRPQSFGVWHISRQDFECLPEPDRTKIRRSVGFDSMTVLQRCSWARLHLSQTSWQIVMEDSRRELRTHLPIFQRAAGRVLVTGLGLGCVVRGLLAKPEVAHIDVVEIDADILRVVGAEFEHDPRVSLYFGDALEIPLRGAWDFAWHDLWTDGDEHLQILHARLFERFGGQCGWQGAWHFPGNLARRLPWNDRQAA